MTELGVRAEEFRLLRGLSREREALATIDGGKREPATDGEQTCDAEGGVRARGGVDDDEEEVRGARTRDEPPEGEVHHAALRREPAERTDLPGIDGGVSDGLGAEDEHEESWVSAGWRGIKHGDGVAFLRGPRGSGGRR